MNGGLPSGVGFELDSTQDTAHGVGESTSPAVKLARRSPRLRMRFQGLSDQSGRAGGSSLSRPTCNRKAESTQPIVFEAADDCLLSTPTLVNDDSVKYQVPVVRPVILYDVVEAPEIVTDWSRLARFLP